MKRNKIAICLAAALGLTPCSVSASQENTSEAVVQVIETAQTENVQTEAAQAEEVQSTEVQLSESLTEDTLTQAIETVEATEVTEITGASEIVEPGETELTEPVGAEGSIEPAETVETQEQTEMTETVEASEPTETTEAAETEQTQTAKAAEEEVLASEAQTETNIQMQNVLGATPEGDGAYFGEQDENDLFWANWNAQGEVNISQVQLLRSLLAKVGKGYSQSMRYDENYYDCSSLILRCLQEFGLRGIPFSTYEWNSRLQGMKVGDVITFHGNGNYASYRLAAVNTDEIHNPEAFAVPGTIIILIEPGYSGGHMAVSLGNFVRQDNELDPQKDAAQIINQTREYVASQLAARYGADYALLMGTNQVTSCPNIWMDSNWLGTDMLVDGAYSGTYNRIWRVEAFNTATGVGVTNVARGTNGLTAKYVLVPVDTDSRPEEYVSIDKVQISNISPKGYQVKVIFSATYGASRVLMPTWTQENGQDDLIWHSAAIRGNTASFYVKTSEHKNEGGHYFTHIYLYGRNGKSCMTATDIQLPLRQIKDYTGFHTETDGASYYYSDGNIADNYTGLVLDQGIWYYIKEGKLDENYTGLVKHRGDWYFVENGCLNWNYTGLVRYGGRWYHVQNGYLNWNYSGLVEYYGTWYYVYKGELNWGYTGLVYDNNIWQYVRGGRRNESYTGLVKYAGEWYYVDKGSVNWNYTGPVEYYGTWYFVCKGYLNWTYSGRTEFDGKVCQVKNGVVVTDAA